MADGYEPQSSSGKRERTKAANRHSILEAARKVFAEMGYEAATVRDIIRRTELASGTFYNYFKSKEEVFEALADDGARRFRPALREIRDTAESFHDYLIGAFEAYYRYVATDHEETGMTVLQISELHPPPVTPDRRAVRDEVRTAMRQVIERGLAPNVDPEYLASAVIGIAEGIGRSMLARDPIDIDGAVTFTAALIMKGVEGLPQRSH